MAYTVKKLAAMSGVSVCTLHFYDEVGLLKPAYIGSESFDLLQLETQLPVKQDLLEHQELRLFVEAISVRAGPTFDKVTALESHRKVLRKNLAKTRKLIVTIDKTIEHLKGTKKMKSQELFVGFDPKQQAKDEQYLIDRYGEGMKKGIAQSKQKVKNWTKANWEAPPSTYAGTTRSPTWK